MAGILFAWIILLFYIKYVILCITPALGGWHICRVALREGCGPSYTLSRHPSLTGEWIPKEGFYMGPGEFATNEFLWLILAVAGIIAILRVRTVIARRKGREPSHCRFWQRQRAEVVALYAPYHLPPEGCCQRMYIGRFLPTTIITHSDADCPVLLADPNGRLRTRVQM